MKFQEKRTNMFKIHSVDYDKRIGAYCINAKCSYEEFLSITEDAELNLTIQRNIIKEAKTYKTLRADLKRGCILPPIVLALSQDFIDNETLERSIEELDAVKKIEKFINDHISQVDIYIIDGLQRTNAIRNSVKELEKEYPDGLEDFLSQSLRLEIWVSISFGAIAYRMLLLNAGQKPMSIKHQVEILSFKLKDDLSEIDGIDIFTSKEKRRRRQPGQFHLSVLAQSFQAWLQKQPNVDIRNTVMEEMLAESAIETLGASLSLSKSEDHDDFRYLMEFIVDVDHIIGLDFLDFFGNETVMLGLSAAFGDATSNPELRENVIVALKRLKSDIRTQGGNALGIDLFNKLRTGIDTKKVNVGVATRQMVADAFEAYFYSAGQQSMERCWKKATR